MKTRLIILGIFLSLRVFSQHTGQQSETIKKTFCAENNLETFLKTHDKTGTTGFFDTTNYWRIQMHFESIVKDKSNPLVYHIFGASRRRKTVTAFEGTIRIKHVFPVNDKRYPPGKIYDIDAEYSLSEDSTKKFSGKFEGKSGFRLHQNSRNILSDLEERIFGNRYSNFTYKGIWTAYKSRKTIVCCWGNGRLPVHKKIDIGDKAFSIADKYIKYGWKKDNKGNYLDNPSEWWKKPL